MKTCPHCGGAMAREIFDDEARTVLGVHIPPMPWALLSFLRKREGRLAEKERLVSHLWGACGEPPNSVENALSTYVTQLRKALRGTGYMIVNRHGAGYILQRVA
jgi:DNA-binding response OmpR family regulator